jgi:cytochrome c biogenesis protein CcdA
MSLVGAISPLGKGPGGRKLFLKAALGYTLAGLVTSTAVGVALGWLGSHLDERAARAGLYGAAVLAVILAAREWGWVRFRLPEGRRQTEKSFELQFGMAIASILWGVHIGLGFATRVTYGGFYVLVAAAVLLGDARYAGLLFAVYWLGRALPVWVAPALSPEGGDPASLMTPPEAHRAMQGAALAWSAVVVLWLAQGGLP